MHILTDGKSEKIVDWHENKFSTIFTYDTDETIFAHTERKFKKLMHSSNFDLNDK